MIDFNIKFKSIASSSSGNCYLLEGLKSKVLIECGIPVAKIDKALDYKLHEIDCCLVSHRHMDHAKSTFDIASRGVEVRALKDTFEHFPKHHRFKPFKVDSSGEFPKYQSFNVNDEFTIYPIHVEHDVPNVAFLIHSKLSGEKLLFIIDTYYFRFKVSGVTHFCVECNYSEDILKENQEKGEIHEIHANRLCESHFSIEDLLKFFSENDLSKAKEINLMHMSNKNSDAELFKKVIEDQTKIKVNVCKQ